MPALDSTDIQRIARVRFGGGSVWFVSPAGLNTNDGLAPQTAFQTLAKAASVAVAGDVIRTMLGTHALGAASLNLPDGVSLWGADRDGTTITSTASLEASGTIVRPGSNACVRDLTIKGIAAAGTDQSAIGAWGNAGQQPFTNTRIQNVRTVASIDGFYVESLSGAVQADLVDCSMESNWDQVACWQTGSTLRVIRCHLIGTGLATASADLRGVVGVGTIYAYDTYVRETSAVGTQAHVYGLDAEGGTIYFYRGGILTASAAGVVKDINVGSGTLTIGGAVFDPAKTSGAYAQALVPPGGSPITVNETDVALA